jgi:membrane protein DedA with SNARE-associated domain
MLVNILRSSEFWVGLAAAVVQFLVSQNIISASMGDFVNMAIVYILGRLLGKVAKAVVPGVPK